MFCGYDCQFYFKRHIAKRITSGDEIKELLSNFMTHSIFALFPISQWFPECQSNLNEGRSK